MRRTPRIWCLLTEPAPGSLLLMTEAQPFAADTEPVRTGVPEVDAVLDSMAGLDETEVSGHPAVFEAAHDQLRRALDDPA